ncbi:hypothetical protein [Bacillus pseudomycoides]|uniref:hypothetical protein n=1 Tax=Bacillus pseudomycoides TaxID=64104 RepID=UPI001FB2D064|nr:hypothetical protein [Bacillus pseudomycoides]
MEQSNLSYRVHELCNVAIEYTKAFDKTFNYFEEDIKELEEILDYYANDLRDKKAIGDEEGQETEWLQETVFDDEEVLHL